MKGNNHNQNEIPSYIYEILTSDEDQPIVQSLIVKLDNKGNLLVYVENIDYDDPRYNCRTTAFVRSSDAQRIARNHRIWFDEIPQLIFFSTAEWRELVNPGFNNIADCFNEITECLLDEGCRLRIKRTYGPGGFYCC